MFDLDTSDSDGLQNMTLMVIMFFQVFLFFVVAGPSKECRVGTRWMHNLIPHPEISLNQNLSKHKGRYVENMNKKSSFFYDTYPQIYIKNCLRGAPFFNFKAFLLAN